MKSTVLFWLTIGTFAGAKSVLAGINADARQTVIAVGDALDWGHYTQSKLDDAMSARILAAYLKVLDPERIFLMQTDVDRLTRQYRDGLGDDVLLGNLDSAKAVYRLFQQRVDERVGAVQEILHHAGAFTTRRTVKADRAHEPWPADAASADAIWRDLIDAELLQEKLNGLPEAPRITKLSARFRSLQGTVDGRDDREIRDVMGELSQRSAERIARDPVFQDPAVDLRRLDQQRKP